jgi:phosphohistidine phosphatase
MKTLLILRHAKSSLKDPSIPDHDRPLDELAKQDALHMGNLLKEKGLIPDFILSSTALRARATTELVVEGCQYKGDIILEQSLYQAKSKDYIRIIGGLSDKYLRVLFVGHNPAVEEAIEILTGSSDVTMSACALAHLNLPIEKWSDFKSGNKQENTSSGAELIKVWRPEDYLGK